MAGSPSTKSRAWTLFDRIVADKIVATGYHWGMPGAGTVQRDGTGYALVPVKA